MFSRIRKRLTFANLTALLALFFAMSAGAYATQKYLITSTKQISPKVLKSLKGAAGKTGAGGPAGTSGPTGPAGPAGPTGPGGPTGAPGSNGSNGSNGVSVTSATLKEGDKTCAAGGSEFKAGSGTTFACNGSPWTAGGTLPTGKSETGAISVVYQSTAAAQPGASAISYALPLKAAPETNYIGNEEELAGEAKEASAIKEGKCKGNSEKPEAASGNLCVFAAAVVRAAPFALLGSPTHFFSSGATGTSFVVQSAESGVVIETGAWAVTG